MQPGTYAVFDTTEGTFTIRLFEKEAPKTVANFVGLAEGTQGVARPDDRREEDRPVSTTASSSTASSTAS